MISHHDIINRATLLAEGGWHPAIIGLYWWSDTGWELRIGLQDWIAIGTPLDELPSVDGLPVPYAVHPLRTEGVQLPEGVKLMGGSRAPDYVEALEGVSGEAWQEQAEAAIQAVWESGDGDLSGPDRGRMDLRQTPYAAVHQWARCRCWRWSTAEMRELRDRSDARRIDELLAAIPSAENPIVFQGRKMRVWRPCGCITDHWQAPHKAVDRSPSKRRFGMWLATQPCLRCIEAADRRAAQ
jgi:hypothetical protein